MEIIPVKIPFNMPLAKRDEQLLQIEDLIDAKRRMLLDKQKKIRFISKHVTLRVSSFSYLGLDLEFTGSIQLNLWLLGVRSVG